MTSADFFGWLQGADFYRDLHREAVALVPGRRRWLDVGTGAGLVALLAAEAGHQAVGADRSAAMVAQARRVAAARGLRVAFEQASLEALAAAGRSAEVVSAASVLFGAPDPAAAAATCWGLVRPGGILLVVETTGAMRPSRALRRLEGHRAAALALWSLARRGRSVAPVLDAFRPPELASARRDPLAGGLVAAWTFTRSPLPFPPLDRSTP